MTYLAADSSTLVLLAKCGVLEIVCELFKVVIAPSVADEVASESMSRKYPDAALISFLISKGSITIQEPAGNKISIPLSLHQGERDTLLLALNLAESLFASDDGKAIKAARFLSVPFIITPKMVVELFRLERITFKKARQSLEKLCEIGRYSPEIIAGALALLMEENDGKAHNHKST
jgi:predicted nucleic acid-binding protein